MTENSYTEGFTCAFCGGSIPASSPELRRVTIAVMQGFPSQELFAHRACVVKVISPKIPLGEVLDDGS
ncbi:hypothetical protein ABT299_05410 [Spirillospora sp. NPDC000708]|uniref:hypothetical protein n=1 Tax=Actinomadura nitritigenes TaxID=134602 RepID=UPI003350D7B8